MTPTCSAVCGVGQLVEINVHDVVNEVVFSLPCMCYGFANIKYYAPCNTSDTTSFNQRRLAWIVHTPDLQRLVVKSNACDSAFSAILQSVGLSMR